ncbi:hypothetical protein AI2916V1_4142 [Enterobacter cloacae]|nr:hypothetical protein AI2916V1_4142 [Enterobacter cloacae]
MGCYLEFSCGSPLKCCGRAKKTLSGGNTADIPLGSPHEYGESLLPYTGCL